MAIPAVLEELEKWLTRFNEAYEYVSQDVLNGVPKSMEQYSSYLGYANLLRETRDAMADRVDELKRKMND